MYQAVPLTPKDQQDLEQLKRDYLQIEDTKVGDGARAIFGRKIYADIKVSYSDGTMIYSGPAIHYARMNGTVLIHNSAPDDGLLSIEQEGIILGLNGMAVGGRRRFTVLPNLVCYGYGAAGLVTVRKEKLIVEATLTDSCIPVFLDIVYFYRGEFRCRRP